MLTDRQKRLVAISFATAFLFMAVSPALGVAVDVPANLNVGPYVDKVVFKVIANQDQRILALQAGEIEMDNSFFDPVHLEALDLDPDIDIFSALRNGYGHITINTRDYPLNISAFRRAFAYAFDKTAVTSEIMDGFSQEQDSLVPYPNSWCIEDDMPYHYYTAQVATGNAILDAAGFTIDPGTGYRLAPDGSPFDVVIEYASSSPEIAGGTAQIGVDALRALDVNARTQAAEFNEYISRLDSHGDYDMVFYAFNFGSDNVDWLAYEYWSEYADVPYQNPTNFVNATYDSWRDQLLYGTDYAEVYEAAAAMQMILQENVPRLVVYENTYMQGYRNDVFTGHVPDLGSYISGPWTYRKIHKIDGTPGGTVPVAISQEPDSFNIFVTNSAYSIAILENLWPSLYTIAPDLTPYPNLAETLTVETHADNAAVPDGHTRFTVDIIQNATWTDGTALTAEDVAFSYTYFFESGVFGNPAATDLTDLVAAYAPTPYRAVIEFSTESWWHFSNFATDWIIPKHIFNDVDGIGYEGWNTWNPMFDPAEPNVNCGPFELTDYDPGEFYEISANPDFHYFPQPSTTTTTSSTTTTEPTTGPTGDNFTLAIVAGAVGAAVVILVGGFVLLRQK
ncbi:MAG: ABC transporter substrate-binding protein [Candidatus Thorarchaeota archaeon]